MIKLKTKIKPAGHYGLAEEYKWRDKHKVFHRIEDMSTQHVFHVVRMVWDHSMPPGWQTTFPNRYRFPAFYTEAYMALTVRLMLPTLVHRQDLTTEQKYWLDWMYEKLRNNPPQIPFIRMIGMYNRTIGSDDVAS